MSFVPFRESYEAPAGLGLWRQTMARNEPGFSGLQGVMEVSQDKLCLGCGDNVKSMIFDCGHECCTECAQRLLKCHECGRLIRERAVPIAMHRDRIAHMQRAKGFGQVERIKSSKSSDALDLASSPNRKKQPIYDAGRSPDRSISLATTGKANDENSAPCQICNINPKGFAFSCGHEACSGCSGRLHACPICSQVISSRTPLTDMLGIGPSPNRPSRKQKEPNSIWDALCQPETTLATADVPCKVCNDNPSTILVTCEGSCKVHVCGQCIAATGSCLLCGRGIKNVTATVRAFVSPQKQATEVCQICEERTPVARIVCKQQCVVKSCGKCASSETCKRSCHLCQSRIRVVDLLPWKAREKLTFSGRCELCSRREAEFKVRCTSGCLYELCGACRPLKRKCCGLDVRSVVPIYDPEKAKDQGILDDLARYSLESRMRNIAPAEDRKWQNISKVLPGCGVCRRETVAYTLGCGHQTCANCYKRLHACVFCNKIIMSAEPIWNKQHSEIKALADQMAPEALAQKLVPESKELDVDTSQVEEEELPNDLLELLGVDTTSTSDLWDVLLPGRALAQKRRLEGMLPPLAPQQEQAGFMGYPLSAAQKHFAEEPSISSSTSAKPKKKNKKRL
eukprot:m.17374 g.17374  ORF g.17374 m.17374 type:complete len:625 (+) comp6004_c0_seq1:84-1958(+)